MSEKPGSETGRVSLEIPTLEPVLYQSASSAHDLATIVEKLCVLGGPN